MNKQIKLKLTRVTCKRCGASWVPRIENPRLCAKCNTPYWNVPRREVRVKYEKTE